MQLPPEIGPVFATPHHAPIELPEQVLTMIVLLLRDATSAAADAEAGSLNAGLMGGIGSVCRSWRRLVKGVLMGDELAWLRVQGAAEAAECLSSFPHAKSLRIVGDAAAGEIVSALGSGSVARLAITQNSVVRNCEGLENLVGLRALCITESRNLESLARMTQLTSLELSGTLDACNALMTLHAVGRGGCAQGCSGWRGLQVASRGAAVRAANDIRAAGAASLAPSLFRMTQLTSLDLGGTLRASAASWRCERLLANAGNALMKLRLSG
jgi:hypothetical protein